MLYYIYYYKIAHSAINNVDLKVIIILSNHQLSLCLWFLRHRPRRTHRSLPKGLGGCKSGSKAGSQLQQHPCPTLPTPDASFTAGQLQSGFAPWSGERRPGTVATQPAAGPVFREEEQERFSIWCGWGAQGGGRLASTPGRYSHQFSRLETQEQETQ